MEKIGFVKSLDGDEATIEIMRASACGEKCASCKGGCAPTAVYARVKNDINASVGQYVKLHSESKKVLKAAFLVYMIPFLGLIMGVMLGFWLATYIGYEKQQELIGAGIGFITLIISYLFLRFRDNKLKNQKDTDIAISHIIS